MRLVLGLMEAEMTSEEQQMLVIASEGPQIMRGRGTGQRKLIVPVNFLMMLSINLIERASDFTDNHMHRTL